MSSATAPPTGEIFKVAFASIIGSVIEQYDFLVTGIIAATVWGDSYLSCPGCRDRRCDRGLWAGNHHPPDRCVYIRQQCRGRSPYFGRASHQSCGRCY
jgi:hypothetical protein